MDKNRKSELLSTISEVVRAETAAAASEKMQYRPEPTAAQRSCASCGAHGQGVSMVGIYCYSCYERELKEMLKEPSTPEQMVAAFKIWLAVLLLGGFIFYLAWRFPL